jgi:hypothetical protein
MGSNGTRVGEPTRRDRLLVSTIAVALLILLGATGEDLGMDRLLKPNTPEARTHSLFRQGCMLYELIPTKPEHRLKPLMERFAHAAVLGAQEFLIALTFGSTNFAIFEIVSDEMKGSWLRALIRDALSADLG